MLAKIKDSFAYAVLRYWLFRVLVFLHLSDRVYVINPLWLKGMIRDDIIPLVDRINSDELETDNPTYGG